MRAFCCDRCGKFEKESSNVPRPDGYLPWMIVEVNRGSSLLEPKGHLKELCGTCAQQFEAFMKPTIVEQEKIALFGLSQASPSVGAKILSSSGKDGAV